MNDAAAPAATAPGLFDNYTLYPSRLGERVWAALRLVVFALALAEVALLWYWPVLGLKLFWTVAVPSLPALFAIAPGLWRQVCPMALANQLPRMLGHGGTRTLPPALRQWSYLIAVALLVAMVGARAPLLNAAAWATGAMCVLSLLLAAAGGLWFKGRSGWCGTFCPLAPVQRSHGQAPIVVVRNGYCPTCVGCQKNCYDFNPRAAIFGDLHDSDERHATQRMLFMSMLPGLIVGYYTMGGWLGRGLAAYWLALAGCMLATAGLFVLLRALLKLSVYRAVTVFGVSALLLYYAFAGPVLVAGLAGLADQVAPAWLLLASRAIGLPIVWGVWRASLLGERAYDAAASGPSGVRIDDSRLQAGPGATRGAAPIEIFERGTGKRSTSAADKTLLEAMEAAAVAIDFGCRSGLCGADPVGIVEGHENLDAPGADELATLRRLGLAGRARLACCTRACGPVTIDCDPRSVPERAAAEPALPPPDLALARGLARVVIVGNGVAGITVAEALRQGSASLDISIVADEPHHFYNRMALGRVVYNRSSMEGMQLLPPAWYAEQRVAVWLNTVAVAIDRGQRVLHLGTGEALPFDRLVLATGARAALPGAGFDGRANAFVLRSAADAQALRAAAQRLGARRAVVIGGGVLGVEAAEALHHLGLRVTLLHRGARLMDRQLDAQGAQCLATYLEHSGIHILTEARIAAFEGEALLHSARLEDGRQVAGDLFVACAGIQPNVALARAAGLAVGRGIQVDEGMVTDDAAILAVGDAAEPARAGPLGLWPVAVEQARRAAASILGPAPAPLPPAELRIVLQLKSDGIDLRSLGTPEADPAGAEVLTADPRAGSDPAWWRLVVQQGRIVAAVYVGPPGTAQALTRVLRQGSDISGCLPALREHRLELNAAAV